MVVAAKVPFISLTKCSVRPVCHLLAAGLIQQIEAAECWLVVYSLILPSPRHACVAHEMFTAVYGAHALCRDPRGMQDFKRYAGVPIIMGNRLQVLRITFLAATLPPRYSKSL